MAKLTAARRAGLAVLAKSHPAPVARSNAASAGALAYWQTADWLIIEGYAEATDGETIPRRVQTIRLTAAGLDLCRSEGIALPDEGSPTVATVTAPPTAAATFAVLPIDQLVPSPGNLRRDLGDLDGLAASIKADGILQALLVTPDFPDPERWVVLAGHRRMAAAKVAGLTEVPCMIREAVPEDGRVATFLVENLRREGLAALEEAEGYRQLVALGWSQRKIAEHVGCGQPHVSKRLALLDLPADIRARIDLPAADRRRISLEEAASLHKLRDHPKEMAKAAAASDVGHAVGLAEARIAYRAAVDKLVADAEAKGWPTRVKPSGYGVKTSWATIGKNVYNNGLLDVDLKKHQAEACHGVLVPGADDWQWKLPTSLEPICTDPGRHKPRGQSKLKVKPAPKRQPDSWGIRRSEEKAGLKEAREARLIPLVKLVAKPPRDATRVALLSAVDSAGFEIAKLACDLLDLDYRAEPCEPWMQPGQTLGTYADAYPVEAAFAVVVARHEEYARRSVGGLTPELYELLDHQGYTPTEWEAAQIAKRAEAAATGAARDLELAGTEEAEGVLRTVDENPALEWPADAVAWYRGFDEDDPARWVEDEGEAEAIEALYPGRIEREADTIVLGNAGGIRTCRACGCTDDHACAGGCSWVEADLCSACADNSLAAAAAG